MRRLFYTILFILIALIILMLVKNEYGRLLPSPGFGMTEIVHTRQIDHLFIGASTFRRGLDIESLEQLPGYSYLLTYNGNQPILMRMQLEYMLRQGVSIKNLYIDFYPYTVAQIRRLSDTRLLLDTDIRFKMDLYRALNAGGESKNFADWLTETFELFVSANNAIILWYPIYRKLNISRNRHGGLIQPGNQHGRTKDYLDNLPHFGKRDGLQADQLQAIGEIIKLCKERGIRLKFVEIPKYYPLLQDPDYIEYADQISKYITDIAGDASIIRANQVEMDSSNPDYFNDLVHMSGLGAHEYTQKLVRIISNL